MAGIVETQEVLDGVVALANAGGRIFEDGKFDYAELVELVPALIKLPAAIQGMGQVRGELADLDAQESEALIEFVRANLDLPKEKSEQATVDALKIGSALYQFVKNYVLKEPELR